MEVYYSNKVANPEEILKNKKDEPRTVEYKGSKYALVAKNNEKGSKKLAYLKIILYALEILGSGGLIVLFNKFRGNVQDQLSILKFGEKRIFTYNLLEAPKKDAKDAKKGTEETEKGAEAQKGAEEAQNGTEKDEKGKKAEDTAKKADEVAKATS